MIEPFVIPNPWDAGPARALAALGFRALASTSGGFAETIAKVAGAGAVGGSIEDRDPSGFLYEIDDAVERVAAAVAAAKALDFPFTLTARAENHIRDNPDLDDTIRRLQAYEAAGADVLYAPGLRSDEEIRSVCSALTKPVNVLAFPEMTVERLAAAGVQRISLGSWLSSIASRSAMVAAAAIREGGDFAALVIPRRS